MVEKYQNRKDNIMIVELLTSRDHIGQMVFNATEAALTCHGNSDKLNEKLPEKVLKNIIKLGHETILEHITLTYRVQEISRALLQELARHRHITLSVESTRHTLKELLLNPDKECGITVPIAPDNMDADYQMVANMIMNVVSDFANKYPTIPNDVLKYLLPEVFSTRLIMTVNARELRHILKLRTHPTALMEFRHLGVKLFSTIPDDFKFLFGDCVYVG